MNYGFFASPPLELGGAEEGERWALQLYDHIASRAKLKDGRSGRSAVGEVEAPPSSCGAPSPCATSASIAQFAAQRGSALFEELRAGRLRYLVFTLIPT